MDTSAAVCAVAAVCELVTGASAYNGVVVLLVLRFILKLKKYNVYLHRMA